MLASSLFLKMHKPKSGDLAMCHLPKMICVGVSHSADDLLEIVSQQALMDLSSPFLSWKVLILHRWLPLGIPQPIFVCVNRSAVIFTQQLPALISFIPVPLPEI